MEFGFKAVGSTSSEGLCVVATVSAAVGGARTMALSSWRENFSSGVSFLRRRFSSNDLQSDDERVMGAGDAASADTAGLNFNLPRGQRGRTRPSPSAPSSPSKSSSSGYGAFARGLFSSSGGGGQRPAYNKDRCKTLLVIDEPHVDWSVSNRHLPCTV